MASRVFPILFCIILDTCIDISYYMCYMGKELQETGDEYWLLN